MTHKTYLKTLLERFFAHGCELGIYEEGSNHKEWAVKPCQDAEKLTTEILDLEETVVEVLQDGEQIGFVFFVPDINDDPDSMVKLYTDDDLISQIIEGD